MSNSEHAILVQNLLAQEKCGVLSTLSRKYVGFPFGSLTPYALSAKGEPIIFVSLIAEHTRNLLADPHVSLFIQGTSAASNPQADARATLLGIAETILADEQVEAAKRYLERFPEAGQNFQLGDFVLIKIRVQHTRYIGGFGEMSWLHTDDLPHE